MPLISLAPNTPSRGLCGSRTLLEVSGCAAPAGSWGGSPRRPGLPPQQESARSRVRGCSACRWPSAVFPPSLTGSQCTAAGLLRQGQALRCAAAGRLGLARGRTSEAAAGGPGGWRGSGRWRAGHRPGCHPRSARGALRSLAGWPPRGGSQRGQEGVPGGPRCWRTSGAGTARAEGQEAHARA